MLTASVVHTIPVRGLLSGVAGLFKEVSKGVDLTVSATVMAMWRRPACASLTAARSNIIRG